MSGPLRNVKGWPWLVLALLTLPAFWHAWHVPDEPDAEFPAVARPTFSAAPPAAYRLAEPGDTIDRVAIYLAALATVLSLHGWLETGRGRTPRLATVAVALGAFWFAANPGPTFDGWHGLGWQAIGTAGAPAGLRAGLALAALGLVALAACGIAGGRRWLSDDGTGGRDREVAGLLIVAGLFAACRIAGMPDVGPPGYWPRWLFVWGLAAFGLALIRAAPRRTGGPRAAVAAVALGSVVWFGMVAGGVWLTWYHRPLSRLRAVVPGQLFISAMPSPRGLEVAQARHHFRTIINLFPEDTPMRSPWHADELRFAARHGVRYIGSPSDTSASNEFLDLTLRVAQDPAAWPVLVHCHGCMDRTPAWVGIYQFAVAGRPLGECLRFIEQHRGDRPKASVTLLYNRVLPRLAPERYAADPVAAVLRRAAGSVVDPYERQAAAERRGTNQEAPTGVRERTARTLPGPRPSLTPRR